MGRFINADIFVSTGQGILGNNMFAYCGNNPVIKIDPFGTWTFGLSLGASIAFGLGISFNVGLVIDGYGNFDLQFSYAIPGVNNSMMIGGVGAGAGVSMQYTNADTVYDLYGESTIIGASAGPGWYIGGDVITFDNPNSKDASVDGGQLSFGVGVGGDAHVIRSSTFSLLPANSLNHNRQKTDYLTQQLIDYLY